LAGASVSHIAEGLRCFRGVRHRLEHVACIGSVDYFNDSKATNPDAAIKALASITKPIVLIGGGYDKDADFSQWVQAFSGKVVHLILIGQTTHKIIATCNQHGFSSYSTADSMQQAVKKAKRIAMPGQVVLLSPACASFGMFKDFEERGNVFKQVVEGKL